MDAAALKQQLGAGATGTYIIELRLENPATIRIGRLGEFSFQPGYYYYVGSAFGPGGVAARCKHHLSISPRPRWHLDYLRRLAEVRRIFFNTSDDHLEHHWAQAFDRQGKTRHPAHGFGASDCDCSSHLFYSRKTLAPKKFIEQPLQLMRL